MAPEQHKQNASETASGRRNSSVRSRGMSKDDWSVTHPDDVFSIIEKTLVEDGYKWHGVKPGHCDWDKLEQSGAIKNFKGTLEGEVDSSCSLTCNAAAIKLDIVERLDVSSDWSARVGIVLGAPGVGKSTSIKHILDTYGSRYKMVLCLPVKQLLDGVFSGRMDTFLIDDIFSRSVDYGKYHTMLVDEITRVHMCEVLVLAGYLGIKNVICFGDPAQGINFKAGSAVNYNFPVIAECYSSRRFGVATADLINSCNGGGKSVVGNNDVKDNWTFEELCGKIEEMSTVLVATHATKEFLADDGIEAVYYEDAQGMTYDVVTIVLKDEFDDDAICDSNVRAVLLTRARKGGLLKVDPNIAARFKNGDFNSRGVSKACTGDTFCEDR
ncbi:42KDa protein [Beet soil-borne mosaic virus]|uniref:42 kDa protein n=1 Tax=Beet soil-borne mosaic virus TaxID=76343 RepID=O72591_9VIRU|nr:42 kDa protein [Beet soil-borne mosaic virus]AAC18570.1 42KDa protein [Beet soil-borne mosaic virus]AEK48986.1 42 kDa protein [Beet soil-borne mosaic virus]APZ76016.1 42K protein [Beet soil-borne mosaic virus]WIW79799.1 triple gene block 1 protein [Beet soil-borne mosaic virus]